MNGRWRCLRMRSSDMVTEYRWYEPCNSKECARSVAGKSHGIIFINVNVINGVTRKTHSLAWYLFIQGTCQGDSL